MGKGPHWELGDRIREAFVEAGWLPDLSYEKIGDKLGLSGGAIGKLLNGHIGGKFETIQKIALLTNCNIEYIAIGRGRLVYRVGGDAISTEGLTEDQMKTVEAVINSYRTIQRP